MTAWTSAWAIAAVVVWGDYRFEVGTLREAHEQLLAAHGSFYREGVCPIGARFGDWVVPAPHYWCGLSFQLWHGATGHDNYLAGEWSTGGWWYFYLLTLLYKVPVPLLILFAARMVTASRERLRGTRAPEAPFLLVLPALILLVFSASSTP